MYAKDLIRKYSTFIFDFDGVVVDSLGIKAEAFGQLFMVHGKVIADQVVAYHLSHGGVSRYEKFKYYYKEFLDKDITPEESGRLDKEYSLLVMERVIAAPLTPGLSGFLTALKDAEKSCFVISGTPQEEMRTIVKRKGLDGFFLKVYGSPCPKKENLQALMQEFPVKAAHAVFFGDAQSDYEAAREGGVDFIGIKSPHDQWLEGVAGITMMKDFN